MILTIFIFLISLLIVCLIYLWFTLLRARNKLSWIPAAPGIPILGSIFEFGPNTETINDISRLTNNPSGLCYCEITFYWVVLVKQYDLLEFLLTSNVIIDKSIDYQNFSCWLGQGLLVAPGTKWKKRRRIITPAFHFSILKAFVDVFDLNGKILVERLKKEAMGKESVDIYTYVTACALDIISESAMGVSVNTQSNKNLDYMHAVKDMCRIIIDRTFSSWRGFNIFFYFTEDYKKQKKHLKILHNFTNSVIETRKNDLVNKQKKENYYLEDTGKSKTSKMAFLDLLLNSTIDGKSLSREDIREEVDTFMFEGHDTTSSGISFTLYLLANHQNIQSIARDEQVQIFGTNRDRPTTHQDLQNMKYLEIVIKESLRLYPPVPMVGRYVSKDVNYKGHTIPKGTLISLFIYGIHRDPNFYESPNEFIPERFYDMGKNPFAYIPFSAGPRNCIGQKFVMLEMKSMISKILRNFELFPTDPPHKLILTNEAVLKSSTGIKIKLKNYDWNKCK